MEETVHNRRQYIERYTKEIHRYYNVLNLFHRKRVFVKRRRVCSNILKNIYKVKKIKGEEIIVFDEESVEEMFEIIENIGMMFHYELPDPAI